MTAAVDIRTLAKERRAPLSEEVVSARVERLPLSGWHVRMMSIAGLAHLIRRFRFPGDRVRPASLG